MVLNTTGLPEPYLETYGIAHFSILSLGDLILSHDFNVYFWFFCAQDSQVLVSSLDLAHELQICICYCHLYLYSAKVVKTDMCKTEPAPKPTLPVLLILVIVTTHGRYLGFFLYLSSLSSPSHQINQ